MVLFAVLLGVRLPQAMALVAGVAITPRRSHPSAGAAAVSAGCEPPIGCSARPAVAAVDAVAAQA
jgi:hypothetical protein